MREDRTVDVVAENEEMEQDLRWSSIRDGVPEPQRRTGWRCTAVRGAVHPCGIITGSRMVRQIRILKRWAGFQ